MFCFVARSKLKCTSPLGYCFLLVYPKKKSRDDDSHTHTHTLVRFVECVCASLYLYLPAAVVLQSVVAWMTR